MFSRVYVYLSKIIKTINTKILYILHYRIDYNVNKLVIVYLNQFITYIYSFFLFIYWKVLQYFSSTLWYVKNMEVSERGRYFLDKLLKRNWSYGVKRFFIWLWKVGQKIRDVGDNISFMSYFIVIFNIVIVFFNFLINVGYYILMLVIYYLVFLKEISKRLLNFLIFIFNNMRIN